MSTPRWLNPEEQAAWRAYLLSNQLLDEALDRQLQRDAGMPHAYYWILVALSEAPDRTMRMSDLARRLRYSQSRLTHAVTSMERRGWVTRDRCPSDGRGLLAALTAEGMRTLVETAPGHVEEVRSRVFDRLTPEQVTQLKEICELIQDGLDPL
ncbi:MarR family winged helix-turn-helix transcriptional regulator [Actinocorallia populi]|uniref:MarR family winged helix-turn-helix transcriptional regulator n=1 Tax=Actinocorallia populi TaxID=2079200 RepID=UPI000D0954BF|nr:MarR family transcriptional regulator [Actinocorallia populi]